MKQLLSGHDIIYAYYDPLRGHNCGMLDGIWLAQEKNRDLLVMQVVFKFGSNQIKTETIIVQTWQNMPILAL